MKEFVKKHKATILIGACIAIVFGFLLCLIMTIKYWGISSIHEDAKQYKTLSCMIYYPDSKIGKKYAKSICKNDESKEKYYDYALVPFGDYYLVRYGNGVHYFVDKNYSEIKLNPIVEEEKQILVDYLRYEVKKNNPELYYTSSFMEETLVEHLDISDVTSSIQDEGVNFYFPKYDLNVIIPFKHAQKCLNMNFGYDDEYIKPIYIDNKKPYVCLTFESGPIFGDNSSTNRIIDTLSKYDANATFFVSGDMLSTSDKDLKEIKNSISKGNEYGSLTQNHVYLPDLSSKQEVLNEINGPIEFFKKNLDYNINLFRPPGGLMDEETDEYIKIPAICWGLDSKDWKDISSQDVVNTVLNGSYEGRVIALHDCYDDTADAIEKIVPELLNKGYQILTISNAFVIEGFDYNVNVWFGY